MLCYLHVLPSRGAQFLLDLHARDRLSVGDEELALIAAQGDQNTEPAAEESADETIRAVFVQVA